MHPDRAAQALSAHQHFVERDLAQQLEAHASSEPTRQLLELFERGSASVPAYAKFLQEHGVDPARIRTLEDFRQLPLTTKANYHHRYALAERCRASGVDQRHTGPSAAGSAGEPTVRARGLVERLAV